MISQEFSLQASIPSKAPWRLLLSLSLLSLVACQNDPVRTMEPIAGVEPLVHLDLAWQNSAGRTDRYDIQNLNLAEDAKFLYVAMPSGKLMAFEKNQLKGVNQAKNHQAWWVQTPFTPLSGPVLAADKLVLGSVEGILAVYNLQGQLVWQRQLSSEVTGLPLVVNGRIFVRTQDGTLSALDLADGQVIWQKVYSLPEVFVRLFAAPVAVGGDILLGLPDGKVERLSQDTGKTQWETQVLLPRGRTDLERMVDVHAPLVVSDGKVYALLNNRAMAALSLDKGQLLWSQPLAGFLPLALDDSGLYVLDNDSILSKLSLNTGTRLWSNDDMKLRLAQAFAASEDYLVAADAAGMLHIFDKLSGKRLASRFHRQLPDGEGLHIGRLKLQADALMVLDNDADISLYHLTPRKPLEGLLP